MQLLRSSQKDTSNSLQLIATSTQAKPMPRLSQLRLTSTLQNALQLLHMRRSLCLLSCSSVIGSQGLQHLLQLCKLGGHLLCCCRGGQPSCLCSICLACFCKSSSLQSAPKHQAWLQMHHQTLRPMLTVDGSQKCLNMVVQAIEEPCLLLVLAAHLSPAASLRLNLTAAVEGGRAPQSWYQVLDVLQMQDT